MNAVTQNNVATVYTPTGTVITSVIEVPIEVPAKVPTPKEKMEAWAHDNVVTTLAAIKTSRADEYESWTEVGRILNGVFSGSDVGLSVWDMWSRSSEKYVIGTCAKKWGTHETDFDGEWMQAYNALVALAASDSEGVYIKPAPAKAKPSDYMEAVHAMGYRFSTNSMNDRLYLNGNLFSDGMSALIMTSLREHGYSSKGVFQDAVLGEGEKHRFHPIKDFLGDLKWDGQDHFGRLASYISDKDGLFALLIRKWMIGAISKVLNPTPTEQNPMLVLAGVQNLGKSVFVHWLGGMLPEYFLASPIYPENKDWIINAASHFVWEVKELGATIKKSDVEALKGFLDTPFISFRAPYGRFEIKKYVTASYIGTINLDGNGFLNDPTGSRRFRVCQLTSVDWAYRTEMDVNQLWAQAMVLYNAGETYLLDKDDEERVSEVNERYVVDDPLADYIFQYFDVDPSQKGWVTPTSEVLSVLKHEGRIPSDIDRGVQMRLSPILSKLGCEQGKPRIGGKQVRGWVGVRLNDKYEKIYKNFQKIT